MTVIHADAVPLHLDETGTIRVANTRITLDILLGWFLLNGVTPEEVVSEDWYPMLSPADVHAVLAYYNRHHAELDEYLRRRREEADQRQNEIEATRPTFAAVKAGLVDRRNAAHAPPAQ